MENLVFVLDIGTRSVIGLVGQVADDTLEVLGVESMEHSRRAVVDGQIEDIEQTARIARQVKERLEEILGVSLREVHVAAAGRVLKTERIFCEMETDGSQPLREREQMALEASAVQKAYEQLAAGQEDENPAGYCSVGHTVVEYRLDGYAYSTLLGHRGKRAGVDLIATFLPNEVVESLYAAMEMIGLSIASITLEPIAAMNAVVPKELHLLNVALVDVGAGTSDIAVADKGSICGYTMATIAGDEVTERVMQEYLVDFETAERMKFAVGQGKPVVEYEDILGIPYQADTAEVLERMLPTIEELAKQIAQGIGKINGNAPKAVFMVGGGSRTPGLCGLVAKELEIDEKRVAIGGSNYMKRQVKAGAEYLSAEYATPIGIGVTAIGFRAGGSLSISLNGNSLQLLGTSMTVLEALRRGGYSYNQIMGRSGKSVVFEYNGERRMVRGGLHTLAEVQVNGSLAGLSLLLRPGDEVTFVPAVDGADASVLLRDLVAEWQPFTVELFGDLVPAGTVGWINGSLAAGDQKIRQLDKVEIKEIFTVGALLELAGFAGREAETEVNGLACTGPEQVLKEGDRISLRRKGNPPVPPAEETVQLEPQAGSPSGPRIWFNGWEFVLPKPEAGASFQFYHLINYVDIDPSDPKGEIVLKRNDRPASYLETIQDGDRIEIRWSQEDLADRVPHQPKG